MLSCRTCVIDILQTAFPDLLGRSTSILGPRSINFEHRLLRAKWPRYASSNAMMRKEDPSASSKSIHERKVQRKRLQLEVVWLQDPAKLASHTLNLLKEGDRDKALDLIRVACKEGTHIISWNHVINHDMSKGRVLQALQTYNEMKKRAQFPDAYTYTILFRGLAAHAHHSSSLQRAISIYHSMSAENSRVRPSVIHTNAVLNVCAKARDLDAIFGIAAKLPVSGPGAPDNYTFTTILNCIRSLAWNGGEELPHETPKEKSERRQRAVTQGKRMWSDIIDRWKEGKLNLDEQLVCAMGRLLLMGNSWLDCDHILSLIEQTMLVPREIPRIGDPSRKTHYRKPRNDLDLSLQPGKQIDALETSEMSQTIDPSEDNDGEHAESEVQVYDDLNIFAPLTDGHFSRFYAVPGRNTLSLLVDACTRMNAIKPAQAYWAKITAKVEPDLENYHTYLRLLRLSRSSGLVVDLLQELVTPKSQGGLGLKPMAKTFRIAMGACTRDKNNPAVITNATNILQLLQNHIEDFDVRIGKMYVEILEDKTGTLSFEKISRGMDMLENFWINVRSLANYGAWGSQDQDSDDGFQPGPRKGSDTRRAAVREGNDEFQQEFKLLARLYGKQIANFMDKYRNELSRDQYHLWRNRSSRSPIRSWNQTWDQRNLESTHGAHRENPRMKD